MKSNSLLLSFAMTATLLTGAPQLRAQSSAEQRAREIYVEGRNLLDDGSYVDAEKKFREALAKYPNASQPDRTTFYLITSLIKQGRTADALAEISGFNAKFPRSRWSEDVEEKRLILSGSPRTVFRGANYGPNYRISIPLPPQPLVRGREVVPVAVVRHANPSLDQEYIRIIVMKDADQGIAVARERLKVNPADPAVISNFSTIASSGSPQAFSFFVVIAGKGSNPNTQTQAQFYLGRLSNDKDAVGKGLVEMVKAENGIPVVAEVLSRSNPNVTRTVLNQVVQYPSPEKLVALERIFYSTPVHPVRAQIVQSAGSMPEPAAREFLTDVAKKEQDVSVRLAAIHSLWMRKDVDVKVLQEVVKTLAESPMKHPVQVHVNANAELVRMKP